MATPEDLRAAYAEIVRVCDEADGHDPWKPGSHCLKCLGKHECHVMDDYVQRVLRYVGGEGSLPHAKAAYALAKPVIDARLGLLGLQVGDCVEYEHIIVRAEERPVVSRVVKRPQGILERLMAQYGKERVAATAHQILSRRPSLSDITHLVRALGGSQDDADAALKAAQEAGDVIAESGKSRVVARVMRRG
jgi:hypothetical protein